MASAVLPNGLQLSTMTLQRISGPMSMYYLKPRKEYLDRFHQEGLDLPLFLFFGDIHQSDENQCDSCDCDEKSSECCKMIHDKSFLRALDHMAEMTPIDFYTEFSPKKETYHKSNEIQNVLFKNFLQYTVKHCHNVESRHTSSYKEKCPTQHIRWHYGDLRHFSSVIEGSMIGPLTLYMKVISEDPYRKTYETMISLWLDDPRHLSNHELYKKAEGFNQMFFELVCLPIEKTQDPEVDEMDKKILLFIQKNDTHKKGLLDVDDVEDFEKEKESDVFTMEIEKIKEKYKEDLSDDMIPYADLIFFTLNRILTKKYTFRKKYIRQFIHATRRIIQMVHLYFDTIQSFEKKSGLWKQLEKQSVKSLRSIDMVKQMLIRICIHKYAIIENQMKLDLYRRMAPEPIQQLHRKIKSGMIDPTTNEIYFIKEYESDNDIDFTIRNTVEEMEDLFSNMNACMVDLYTILRMMKTPVSRSSQQKETQPTLSLGFYGDAHVRTIVSLLLSHPFYYEIEYYRTNRTVRYKEETSRCIEIDESIPLARDLELHHRWRMERSNHPLHTNSVKINQSQRHHNRTRKNNKNRK